jgi:hypothetical protein
MATVSTTFDFRSGAAQRAGGPAATAAWVGKTELPGRLRLDSIDLLRGLAWC